MTVECPHCGRNLKLQWRLAPISDLPLLPEMVVGEVKKKKRKSVLERIKLPEREKLIRELNTRNRGGRTEMRKVQGEEKT